MNRDPSDIAVGQFDLAGVQSAADLEAKWPERVPDRSGTPDRPGRAVEDRKEAVASGLDLAASESLELRPRRAVVGDEQGTPSLIADLGRPSCRLDEVGEEDGGKDSIRFVAGADAREKLLDLGKQRRLVAGPRQILVARQLNIASVRDVVRQVLGVRRLGIRADRAWAMTIVGMRIVGSTCRTSPW